MFNILLLSHSPEYATVRSICSRHALESRVHLEEYVAPSDPQTGENNVAHNGHSKINDQS